jgi:hypothetical protein
MTTNTTNSADGSAGAGERERFEAWMRDCEGNPYAGQYANLMWKAWKARAAIDKGDTQAGGGAALYDPVLGGVANSANAARLAAGGAEGGKDAQRGAIYRKALAMGDGPDVVGPAWQAEGGKSESFEEAAKICEKWAASIDTGKKRNRVVAAAMQGALTCASEIRAAIGVKK